MTARPVYPKGRKSIWKTPYFHALGIVVKWNYHREKGGWIVALTIQERLKDLRVERGLTLEQLAEQTHLSKSALGSYEADEYKDISHYALIKLAKFYGVTADYLLGLTETKNHPNADLADLHLSDELIDLLKNGRIDTALFCELATHKDFVKLLADIEIYVNGIATGQIQNLNAWVDVARAEIMEKYQSGEHDKTAYLLNAIHVQEGEYFSRRVHDDIDGIMEDIKESHKGRAESAPEKSVAAELKKIWTRWQTSREAVWNNGC